MNYLYLEELIALLKKMEESGSKPDILLAHFIEQCYNEVWLRETAKAVQEDKNQPSRLS